MRTRTRSQIGKSSRRCGTAAERAAKAVLLKFPSVSSVERNLKSMAGLGGDDLIVENQIGEKWTVEVKEWKSVPLTFYSTMVGISGVYGPRGGEYLTSEFYATALFNSRTTTNELLKQKPGKPNWPRATSFLKVIRDADVLMFRRKDRTGWPWLFYFRKGRPACV